MSRRTEGVGRLCLALCGDKTVHLLEPLKRQPYGGTEFVVRDRNGYALVFAERLWSSPERDRMA